MTHEGTVLSGEIESDAGMRFPAGTRIRFEVIEVDEELDMDDWPDLTDPSLPEDHPHAPYNREVELRLLRESIAEMKAGGGRPFEEVMAEIALKHGLPPVAPE